MRNVKCVLNGNVVPNNGHVSSIQKVIPTSDHALWFATPHRDVLPELLFRKTETTDIEIIKAE